MIEMYQIIKTDWLVKFHNFSKLAISECTLYSMVPTPHMEVNWKPNIN